MNAFTLVLRNLVLIGLLIMTVYRPAWTLDNTAGFSSLLAGFGARSAVLGGPVPATGDAESLYWNPAGLAVGHAHQAMATHYFWLDNLSIDQLGLILPAPWAGNWGIGASLLTVPSFNSSEYNLAPPGSGLEGASWLSGGIRLLPDLNAGLSAKFLFSKWLDYSSFGGAADLGLIYQPEWLNVVQVQASVLNLGAASILENEADRLPTIVHLSSTIQLPRFNFIRPRLIVSTSLESDSKVKGALASEIDIFKFMTIRGGYHINAQSPGKWSSGLSISWSRLQFDYGVLNLPELGLMHLVGLKYYFTPTQGKPEAQVFVQGSTNSANQFSHIFKLTTHTPTPIYHWDLSIFSRKQSLIKNWNGTGSPPPVINWDRTDNQGKSLPANTVYNYKFEVIDKVFREDIVFGELLSETTTLAPKITKFDKVAPSAQRSSLHRFNFQQINRNFQPKTWTMEFKNASGNVIKRFEHKIKGKHIVSSQIAQQEILLPAQAISYTLILKGNKNQKQQLTAPLISASTGIVVIGDNKIINKKIPIIFNNATASLKSWQLKIVAGQKHKLIKNFQGHGQPPANMSWQPQQTKLNAMNRSKLSSILIVKDQHGIVWQKEDQLELVNARVTYVNKQLATIEIGQILFEYNQYLLNSIMFNKIKASAHLINDYPGAKVLIKGHTDERGSAKYNLALSQKRALSVKRYLAVKEKLSESILSIKGFGFNLPYKQKQDHVSRRKNRRVEILITLPTK